MAKRGSEGRSVRLRHYSIIFRSVYSQTGENIEGFALKVLPWGFIVLQNCNDSIGI